MDHNCASGAPQACAESPPGGGASLALWSRRCGVSRGLAMPGCVRGLGAFAAVLLAGSVHAQVLEIHADGGVVSYDGATQHVSRGAVPTARLLTPAVYHPRHGR